MGDVDNRLFETGFCPVDSVSCRRSLDKLPSEWKRPIEWMVQNKYIDMLVSNLFITKSV